MSNSLSQESDDEPRPPDDRELLQAVTLATAAALVAGLLTHDVAVAVEVFVVVAGGLRPR